MKVLGAMLLAGAMSAAAGAQAAASVLVQANALLQSGEADKAIALLDPLLVEGGDGAEAHNLKCRVRLSEGSVDAAVSECEKAVSLEPDNAMMHVWLGRALGDKADQASFLSAYSLAKRLRGEFEEAVKLDPRNGEALASLGEFDCSAPGVVGGGLDKAEAVAGQLDKVDPPRAHELHAQIAEQRKDYATAEQELKQAIAVGPHAAYQWMALASFYRRRQRWNEMIAAVRSGESAARRDKRAAVALYNGASTLVRANKELPLAARMLEEYVASPNKTEEGPAFVAYARLARVNQQLGDKAAADRDLAAASALAHDYNPQGRKH